MRSSQRQRTWQISLAIGMAVATVEAPAHAQLNLTPDTDANRSLGTTVQSIDAQSQLITGGARPQNGANLFHSFQEFNVPEGRAVFFDNPTGVQSIFSRVTGSDPSDILGTIGVRGGTATLFLLNPTGILFGPNARLDIAGSFVATTATAIQFGSVGRFSATAPESPALLTVNPSALLFNQLETPPIVVQTQREAGIDTWFREPQTAYEGLNVPTGQSLLLVGGNVQLDNGVLQALSGRIDIGGLAGAGTVELTQGENRLRLGQFTGALSDVTLTQTTRLDGRGNTGSVAVTARNITLFNAAPTYPEIGPTIVAGATVTGSLTDQAGDITLSATGDVSLTAGNLINRVPPQGQGSGGNIRIQANSLTLQTLSNIDANSDGAGNAGRVIVDADRVRIDGSTANQGLSSTVFSNAPNTATSGGIQVRANSLELVNAGRLSSQTYTGNAGDIVLEVGSLLLDSSAIDSSTFSPIGGNGGNITILARDNVTVLKRVSDDETGITSRVQTASRGNAGNINIGAGGVFSLRNDANPEFDSAAILSASTNGQGNAGSVTIRADRGISLSGSGGAVAEILTTVASQAQGNGGAITFVTDGPLSFNTGRVASTIERDGQGTGGSITIAAGPISLTENSAIQTTTNGVGNAGSIQITGRSLALNQSRILGNTNGHGNAGNITVAVQGEIALDQSGIASTIDASGQGNGGSIQITGSGLSVTTQDFRSAGIFSSLAGADTIGARGRGGDITIDVGSGSVLFDGVEGGIDSSLFRDAEGKGGNVEVTAGSVTIRNGARIRGRTFGLAPGSADAGNITINTTSLSLETGGQITASTSGLPGLLGQGKGGDIRIRATGDVSLVDRRTGVDRTTGRINDGDDRAGIYSDVSNSIGQGGTIEIQARSLSVLNGALISSNTSSIGNAGTIRIQAADTMRLSRETDVAGIEENGAVTIGNLYASGLLTDTRLLNDGTGGRGGDIEVSAPTLQLLNGSVISATTSTPTQDGGNVQLAVRSLTVGNGGQVLTSTFNSGSAGSITIAGGEVLLSGSDANFAARLDLLSRQNPARRVRDEVGIPTSASSGLFADTTSSATGTGGSITLKGAALTVLDSAQLSAQSQGRGDAGSLSIAVDRLRLDRQGKITTDTTAAGAGGSIAVVADQFDASGGGQLRTTTFGMGAAGNITVQVSDRLRLRGSGTGFFADTESGSTGSGGSIF
ncbi:filamentous hemagglutinin N-terminal domain-containing protein, partial [Leptolyngbya sp. FACHB-36]|uniref:two-partner secretion domain-containing protein n=1 Tax=Leptolyngbya sp. FACHB-36 TaxID=2692808 RepID=UPI00167FF57C